MIARFIAALALPEVRRRVQFVVLMFAVYVLALHIPVPGIDRDGLARMVDALGPGALQFMDLFSGGAFRNLTILALGLTPYINASILMQMLVAISPRLSELAKEGEAGRKTITRYTRYLTALFAVVEGAFLLWMLRGWGLFPPTVWAYAGILATLCAGTALLVWMGELITRHGVGQGVSLLILGNIVASLPYQIGRLAEGFSLEPGAMVGPFELVRLGLLFLATMAGVIAVTQATRRIPIQYARRPGANPVASGGRVGAAPRGRPRAGTEACPYLPFNLNSAGVLPLFYALSVLETLRGLASRLPEDPYAAWGRWLFDTDGGGIAPLFYAALILLFTWLSTAIQMKIPEMAEDLKRAGAFIPGIRPGGPTEAFLDRALGRLTLAGGLFLAALGLVQCYTHRITGVPPSHFSLIGGTSLLIVVGVVLDTTRSLEAHLSMGQYRGFIREGQAPGACGVLAARGIADC